MKTKFFSVLTIALCTFALAVNTSCKKGGDEPAEDVSAISLNKVSLDMFVGDNATLVATTTPAGAKVTWSSSAESVAKVDANGQITALAEGTAKITAKAGAKTAQCMVRVYAQIDPSSYECLNGTSYYVGILSPGAFSKIESRVIADLRDDGGTTSVTDVWPNGESFTDGNHTGSMNPFGESYADAPWYCMKTTSFWEGNVGGAGIRVMKDVNMSGIDNSYYLHIDYLSNDGALNEVCLMKPDDGKETWISLPIISDGQWHSFDKPLSDVLFKGAGNATDYFKTPYVYVEGTDGRTIFGWRVNNDKTKDAGMQMEWASLFIYKPAAK